MSARGRYIFLALLLSAIVSACTSTGQRTEGVTSSATTSGSNTTSTSNTSNPPQTIYASIPSLPPTTAPAVQATDDPTGASPVALTDADYMAMESLFSQWSGFTSCPIVAIPSTFHAAVISTTGVTWAFGKVESQSGCTVKDISGQDVAPISLGELAPPYYNGGVFEKQPGGNWVMNSYESDPFPCPDNPAYSWGTPGFDLPWVPLSVLNAVGVAYAPAGCANAVTQPPNR